MKKIETTIDTVKNDIRAFYKPGQHHFIVMNAVDLGAKMEVQWFFSDYTLPDEVTVFYLLAEPGIEIPSIREIIGSAWVAEAELVDLMNISIENATKGFVLEPDSESGPLRKKK
ncbi:MAG: NADH-quinone oxidoreductase subunit C [Bacteroidetes bacterium]|nr:NADH-quinone oxidoreductase subunit C [Bacteroidota bacterium]